VKGIDYYAQSSSINSDNLIDNKSIMYITSYRVILFSLISMIIAAVMLYFDAATIMAYVLLVAGFFGIGIGILIGFFKMIRDQ